MSLRGKKTYNTRKATSLPIHFSYVFFFRGPVGSQKKKKRYYFGNLFLYLMYVINIIRFQHLLLLLLFMPMAAGSSCLRKRAQAKIALGEEKLPWGIFSSLTGGGKTQHVAESKAAWMARKNPISPLVLGGL